MYISYIYFFSKSQNADMQKHEKKRMCYAASQE